ncbi:MAG TPA: phospholipase D-like domain-containing protein [Longimicrobiales bacterium]|nr:phospholipase D-like domain-containing protein [Longimicrobiales bacterium]
MWLNILLATLLALLILVLATFFGRGTPIRQLRVLGDERRLDVRSDLFLQTFATLTSSTFSRSNRVELLLNGDQLYDRLWADLRSARDLITWHVFWFKPGRLADRLADILVERAQAGVRVLFLYDYYGSMGIDDDYYQRLRDAGVEVAAFRAPRWDTLYKLQQRMHVRAVVVDGRVGWTGGFAVCDEWTGDGRSPGQWRDTSVRVEGSVVDQLQSAFISNWAETTGELLTGQHVLPFHGAPAPGEQEGEGPDDRDLEPDTPEVDVASAAATSGTTDAPDPRDDITAGLLFGAPSLGSTNAERYFLLSIHGARERLYITSAYFVPARPFREALKEAVARGVDVRVLTPGENTDRPTTLYAVRRHYEELLKAGIRIWHYQPTMIHAKTLVVDGIWGAVGTVNFDNRSMALNDEVAVVVRDADTAGELEDAFLTDLEYAREVDLETVRSRGAWPRIQERAASLVEPLL